MHFIVILINFKRFKTYVLIRTDSFISLSKRYPVNEKGGLY